MTGKRTLLRGGTIVPVAQGAPDEFVGDILIEDDKIAAMGPRVEVDEASCEVIDVSTGIVLPGFVDTHRHTWQAPLRLAGSDWSIAQYVRAMFTLFGPQFTPEDAYTAHQLGIADALHSGITQLLDWNHNLLTPDHADAVVQAHRDSGARMVLGYGQSSLVWQEMAQNVEHKSWSMPSEDIRRLRSSYYSSADDLISLCMAARGPEISRMDVVRAEWLLAEDLDLDISVHVGNGAWAAIRPIVLLRDAELLNARTTYIHCNALTDEELTLIASSGGRASVSVEEEWHMGHGTPAVDRLLALGVRPSLSIDTCSNVGGSMFALMRAALAVARGARNQRRLDAHEEPVEIDLSVLDALRLATTDGARCNGLDAITGSLEPGKKADLQVIRTDTPAMFPVSHAAASVVMGADPTLVDLVMVDGVVKKRNGHLVGVDVPQLRRGAEDLRDRLFALAGATTGGWKPELPSTEHDFARS